MLEFGKRLCIYVKARQGLGAFTVLPSTSQMITLFYLMHVTQALQIRPATVTFSDVALMVTGCCTENSYKLFLKFNLKHVVYIDSNFMSKTFVTSVHSTKCRRIRSIYENTVPVSMAWETSVGQPYLLQQNLAKPSLPWGTQATETCFLSDK